VGRGEERAERLERVNRGGREVNLSKEVNWGGEGLIREGRG
jgi:hypothetical protein